MLNANASTKAEQYWYTMLSINRSKQDVFSIYVNVEDIYFSFENSFALFKYEIAPS